MEELTHNYFRDLYYNLDKSDINVIMDFAYFMNEIYKKITIEFREYITAFNHIISDFKFFDNIFKTVELYVLNTFNTLQLKEINELVNKFILTKIYNSKFPITEFVNYLINFLETLEENKIDELFIYYRNSLINRLYTFKFDPKIVGIEKNIISGLFKISQKFNNLSLYKLERIISDISESQDFTKEFNTIYDIDSQIIIARYSIWGISSHTQEPKYNNPAFEDIYNKFTNTFENYYCNQKFEKRKLTWNHNLSYCVVGFKNNSNNNKSNNLTITCSLMQSNLLYKFNNTGFIDLDKEKLTKPEKITLKHLIKNKILVKENSIISINNINNNIDIRDIKFSNNNKKRHNRNEKISAKNKSCENEICFTQEDYINLLVLRTLKHKKNMDKPQLIALTKEKYGYTEEIIIKALDKLVERILINFYSIDNRVIYSYVI